MRIKLSTLIPGAKYFGRNSGEAWHGERNWEEATWLASGMHPLTWRLDYPKLTRLIYFLLNFQIYLDMAVLVDAQGELLDNIETQVYF